MKIKKIYFDMDGVLADFDRGIRDLCSIEPIDQANKPEVDDDNMWAAVKRVDHFYDKLELMPGAKEMFSTIWCRYRAECCEILSGIPKPRRGIVTAGEDKTNWAHRNLRRSLPVNIVFREEKKNYVTGPDCVLIDDLEENIKEWETCGGTGILYKSPKDTIKRITEIEAMLGGNKLLATPVSGWSEFMLGKSDHTLSYIIDVARPWLNQAIEGLKEKKPFTLYGDGETTDFECTVFLDHVELQSDLCDDEAEVEMIPVSMLDFCKMLHDDLRADVKDWANWDCTSHGLSEEGKRQWLIEEEGRITDLLMELAGLLYI